MSAPVKYRPSYSSGWNECCGWVVVSGAEWRTGTNTSWVSTSCTLSMTACTVSGRYVAAAMCRRMRVLPVGVW